MWAFGTTKKKIIETQKIPLADRKPSDGIILMEVPIPEIKDNEVFHIENIKNNEMYVGASRARTNLVIVGPKSFKERFSIA